MTKSEVKKALDNALIEYNNDMEEYALNCSESEKELIRKLTSSTMECLAEFSEVIEKLAD